MKCFHLLNRTKDTAPAFWDALKGPAGSQWEFVESCEWSLLLQSSRPVTVGAWCAANQSAGFKYVHMSQQTRAQGTWNTSLRVE